MNLVSKLHVQLAESRGKKVYGYLKSDVKKTVDEIFMRLADNESVKKDVRSLVRNGTAKA